MLHRIDMFGNNKTERPDRPGVFLSVDGKQREDKIYRKRHQNGHFGTAAGKEAAVFQKYVAVLTVERSRAPSMRFAPFRLLLGHFSPFAV